MFRWSILSILVGFGCAEVPAGNPFDPATPADQQVPGQVAGRLTLPEGYSVALFEGSRVELRANADPAAAVLVSPVDGEGAFAFAQVVAGGYTVQFGVPGLVVEPFQLDVAIGSLLDVGEIAALPLADDVELARLVGQVELAAQPAGQHGGVVVEVLGTPLVALTASDGRWALDVPAGRHDLRFSRERWGTEELSAIEAQAGDTTEVGAVILVASPGRIQGQVCVDGEWLALPAGLEGVTVSLTRAGEAEPQWVAEPEPVAEAERPAADPCLARGRFAITPVPAGEYLLAAVADGYQVALQAVVVEPAAVIAAELRLVPVTLRARIRGEARFAGRAQHAGIDVRLEGSNLSTTTNAEGRYAIEAPLRQDPYVLQISRDGYNHESVWASAPTGEELADLLAGGAQVIDVMAAPNVVSLTGLPGSVRGQVRLADGFGGALAGVDVRLYSFDDPSVPIRTTNPDADGLYVFEALPAGDYQIEMDLEGFVTQIHTFQLLPGETALAPTRTLAPDLASSRAFLQGVAVRECHAADPADCDHSGILVEAVDTPFVALTARDGRFQLEVVESSYHLRFSAAGFDSQDRGPFAVVPDEFVDVGRVELPAHSGGVAAVIALRRYATPARLLRARLELRHRAADAVPVASVPPENGAVFVPDVVPGDYHVRVVAPGYESQARTLTVAPGELVYLGVFDLQHQSEGPSQTELRGRVRLEEEQTHAGTRVRVRLADDDLAFGPELQTDAQGWFGLRASPEERYRVVVEREDYDPVPPAGPLSWRDGQFLDEGGAPVDLTLVREEVTGSIAVSVDIAPAWIPARDRYVRVRVWGEGIARTEERVEGGEPGRVVFDALPIGTYFVQAEREGFSATQQVVKLTDDERVSTIGLTSALRDLAVARLDLEGVPLGRQHLAEAVELRIRLAGANLSGVVMSGVDLTGIDLDLSGANLSNANLSEADLSGLDLSGADLFGANLGRARLFGTDLSHANLSSTNLRDTALSRDDRRPNPPCDDREGQATIRLEGALLAQADLTGARMAGIDLSSADLSAALMQSAHLSDACLRDANLTLTDLSQANFTRADLSEASLVNAIVHETVLRGARLDGASLASAVVERSDLGCDVPRNPPSRTCQDQFEPNNQQGQATRITAGSFTDLDLCDGEGDTEDWFVIRLEAGDTLEVTVVQYLAYHFSDMIEEGDFIALTLHGADGIQIPIPECVDLGELGVPACFTSLEYTTRRGGAGDYYLRLSRTNDEFPRPYSLHVRINDVRPVDPGLCTSLVGANLNGANLVGANFQGADLSGATMLGAIVGDAAVRPDEQPEDCVPYASGDPDCRWPNLDGCVENEFTSVFYRYCDVTRTSFLDADLTGAMLSGVTFSHADLRGAQLREVAARGAAFVNDTVTQGVSFRGGDLGEVNFAGQYVAGMDFDEARLNGASFDRATIIESSFRDAALDGIAFRNVFGIRTDLGVSDGRQGYMTFADFSGTMLLQCSLHNRQHRSTFTMVDSWLSYVDLRGVEFNSTDLRRIRFDDVQLEEGARFSRADLTGADLHGTVANPASLRGAGLRNAILTDADLRWTDLSGAHLGSARVDGADFEGAVFSDDTTCPSGARHINEPGCDVDPAYCGETCRVANTNEARIIAPRGNAINFRGTLTNGDPIWRRPEANCTANAGRAINDFYNAFAIRNDGPMARTLTITANWTGGDGFLAVYRSPFNPGNAAQSCIAANDDSQGMVQSRVQGVVIQPGQTLVVVPTVFGGGQSIPSYAIEVLTTQ